MASAAHSDPERHQTLLDKATAIVAKKIIAIAKSTKNASGRSLVGSRRHRQSIARDDDMLATLRGLKKDCLLETKAMYEVGMETVRKEREAVQRVGADDESHASLTLTGSAMDRLKILAAKRTAYQNELTRLKASPEWLPAEVVMPASVACEAARVEAAMMDDEMAVCVSDMTRALERASERVRNLEQVYREHSEVRSELQRQEAEMKEKDRGVAGTSSRWRRGDAAPIPNPAKARLAKIESNNVQLMKYLVEFLQTYYKPPSRSERDRYETAAPGAGLASSDVREGRSDEEESTSEVSNTQARSIGLKDLLQDLMNACVRDGDPYVDVGRNSGYFYPPYIELLIRSGVAVKDPADSNRLKLVEFHR